MASETPLVHRPVRTGGLLLMAGALQFVVVMLTVQMEVPGFSLTSTRIGDLSAAAFPWGTLFNGSLLLLGLLALFGLLLAWSAFDSRPARGPGLLLLLAAAMAAVVYSGASLTSALSSSSLRWVEIVAVLGAGLGLIAVSFAMHREARWRVSRAYTLLSGLVIFVTGGLYASGTYLAAGPGGLERIGLGVALLWLIVEGGHIALLHRFAPGLHVKVAAA